MEKGPLSSSGMGVTAQGNRIDMYDSFGGSQ